MPETPNPPETTPPRKPGRRARWDALGVIIAALIGLLALVVSGYTAHIQRQQVRAEVWPFLLVGAYPSGQAVGVHNKGVGPAIVRTVEIRVDGKPQRDWNGVLGAMGLGTAGVTISTIHDTVISPGERMLPVSFADRDAYERFLDAARRRVDVEICYCSTLGDCWLNSDRGSTRRSRTRPVDRCPALPASRQFLD